ncbi:LOW QUALITY PROTEIN: hyaluronidase-4-like [Leptosomus discolor]
MFHMIRSLLAKARGQNITMFYFSRLSYYPWDTSPEVPVNGLELPNFSLQTHLEKEGCDTNYYVPGKEFSGLALVDWEHWRPQWAHNDAKDVYRRQSRKLITKMEGNNSANVVEHLARVSFDESAKAFMKETIALGMKRRLKGLWGHYSYPDYHNYNFHDQNYTDSCPKSKVLRNNELSWLWNSSATLYPSTGIKKPLGNSKKHLYFYQFRLNETIRISFMTSRGYALPTFVYLTRILCIYTYILYTTYTRDESLLFLSMQDLINTIGDRLGAAGIVIWRDMNLTSSEGFTVSMPQQQLRCVKTSLSGQWMMCVKNLESLNISTFESRSFQIDALENQGFIVRGEASNEDLEIMAETFFCHCYQGYEGTDCGEVKVADDHSGSSAGSVSPRRFAVICLLPLPLISLL